MLGVSGAVFIRASDDVSKKGCTAVRCIDMRSIDMRALSPVAECALGRAFHPVGLTEFETSFPLKRWASKTRDLFIIMSAQSKLRARRKDAVRSMLRARQKDGKRIGFLRTGDKALREMLRPVTCAILSLPSEYGFALPGMVELLRHRNLYRRTGLKDRFDDYKYLKDVLHRPKQRSLDELRKIKYEEFLEGPLTRIIHLQTYEKDGWSIVRLWDVQEALRDSQLLIVEVQASDSSCHFLFEGPPRPETLFLLKEGSHFHGIKDSVTFLASTVTSIVIKKSPFVLFQKKDH